MDILEFLEKKKPLIDSLIRKYIPENPDEASINWMLGEPRYEYDGEAIRKALADPVWEFLNRGGKRWRPVLFLLIAEALRGDVEKIKDFAILPELAHNGSIIIDDIEDQGEMRRGKPCSHKIFGLDVAINTGNFLYFLPMLVFIKNPSLPKESLLKAYEAFAQEMINIHIGQATDIHWHKGGKEDISEDEYLQMCAYKTGCLSRMAGRIAVILSGGDKEKEDKIGKFSENLGIAFQIQDDILSASGDEFSKRKGFGDDITEGKRSILVIHTLKNATPEDKSRLIEILDMHTKDEALITEALQLLKKYNSIEYGRSISKKLVEDAWAEIDPILEESEAKSTLNDFVKFAIERQI
jgi:geranylgeranyl pyrophosphate synthase